MAAADIATVLREMMDRPELEWFKSAAERIDTYYSRFGSDEIASVVLNHLCGVADFAPEAEIVDSVRRNVAAEGDTTVIHVLELRRHDNYIVRDTSAGGRRYRFRYRLMRDWWKINRG